METVYVVSLCSQWGVDLLAVGSSLARARQLAEDAFRAVAPRYEDPPGLIVVWDHSKWAPIALDDEKPTLWRRRILGGAEDEQPDCIDIQALPVDALPSA